MAVKFKFAMKNLIVEQWEKDNAKNWKEKRSSGVAWLGLELPTTGFESQSAYFLTSGSE